MTAIHALADVVGDEHVVTPDDPRLDEYADPFPFSAIGGRPAGAVRPGSVEEVQAVVRAAGEHGVPLWTVSRGRNLGYGGAGSRVPDAILLDLSRLDRVVAVDEECAAAIVEPGVSFFALYDHLREHHPGLMISAPDLGGGSVVGNTLERGFGYTAHGEHAQQQCGLEVVLADGLIVRTGMGALPESRTWPLYKGAFGPLPDGLFFQSNLGVVTKMGVWLLPRPEAVAACMVQMPNEADIGALVEAMRPLLLDGTIQSNAIIGNALAVASGMTPRAKWYDREGLMPEEAIRSLIETIGIGWWNCRFGLYGPRELVAARRALVERAFAAIPGARVVINTYDGDVDPGTVFPPDRAQLGIPSSDAIQMAAWRGGDPAHTDFTLVCPPTSEDVLRQSQLIRDRLRQHEFDYAGGFAIFRRHGIALCLLSFDRSSPDDARTITELFPQLVADGAAAGYAPYRAHPAFMDLIADQYGWGDHAQMRLNQRLKDALDPDGILSPGKQGVWSSESASV